VGAKYEAWDSSDAKDEDDSSEDSEASSNDDDKEGHTSPSSTISRILKEATGSAVKKSKAPVVRKRSATEILAQIDAELGETTLIPDTDLNRPRRKVPVRACTFVFLHLKI
jgi:hypothetical protein